MPEWLGGRASERFQAPLITSHIDLSQPVLYLLDFLCWKIGMFARRGRLCRNSLRVVRITGFMTTHRKGHLEDPVRIHEQRSDPSGQVRFTNSTNSTTSRTLALDHAVLGYTAHLVARDDDIYLAPKLRRDLAVQNCQMWPVIMLRRGRPTICLWCRQYNSYGRPLDRLMWVLGLLGDWDEDL